MLIGPILLLIVVPALQTYFLKPRNAPQAQIAVANAGEGLARE
jgi:hypothetical protein